MASMYRWPYKLWRLLSILITVWMVMSLVVPATTSTALALDIPQPVYPANYAQTTSITDPPLGVPSFSWTSVNGALKYRLQVDNDIGFNNPIALDTQTASTSYTPASSWHLFADGVWYWRVRVDEPGPVGEWSNIMSFTKVWATPENAPTLVEPVIGEVISFFDFPVFNWTRVIGAARYRFQIAASYDGFDSPIVSVETLSNFYQPSGRLENGSYYWRVIPIDTADHFGTASERRSFSIAYGVVDQVPLQLEPANWSYPTFTPTFRWTAVPGAGFYRLEYTSDETCDFSIGTVIITRQTSYTPTDTFPNDKRYCWHVRVESGPGVGSWSPTWFLQKRWYLQPHLLTPTNLYQTGIYPVYSWTPVPGAAYYRIEVSHEPSFSTLVDSANTANTTYAPSQLADGHLYWRVTPYDGGGRLGMTSEVFEFQIVSSSLAPVLIYPLYYYIPNNPIYYEEHTMNPVEDRTVAYPIFMWQRVMNTTTGGLAAPAYRVQVAQTPYFTTIVWDYDTENTSASPTAADNFSPIIGQDYYWRVCPLDHLNGNCLTGPTGAIWWSQTWRTRFDPTYNPSDPVCSPFPWVLPPTHATVPELLRPSYGQEVVEATPLLEWWPLSEDYEDPCQIVYASQYQVEVSREADFATHEISETVNIPAYSPTHSLAQRSLNRLDYGTFYWRVRALLGGEWTDWSISRRFQIASQSEWRFTRTIGDPANRLLIGDDPPDDAIDPFDLNTLFATQSSGSPAFWYFGFNAEITTANFTYVFYIDVDNIDGSGGDHPPEGGYSVTTIAAHRPEYAITIGPALAEQNVMVYAWNGVNDWYFGQSFNDIGGHIYVADGYIELQIPYAAIGMSNVTNSASIVLFSVDNDTNAVLDTVPSNPIVPGATQLSNFSSVSERLNLVYPPDINTGDVISGTQPLTDTRTIPSFLPFYWDWPTGSNPSTPFAGSKLEIHLDPGYTNKVAELGTNGTSYYSPNHVTTLNDVVGDNIYYWRVQPTYRLTGNTINGAWASGWSFRRVGLKPLNLQTSVNFATPTFRWDMVEGASTYRLQVSTDPNFGSLAVDVVTPLTSYTPVNTLMPAFYYWRVQVVRYGGAANDWSARETFNLQLPTPTGLTPDGEIVPYAPTFCWNPMLMEDGNGDPVLTAWKYRVQVSRDPNFSQIFDSVETFNNCWTPTMGYLDGEYYWHVAMIDGNGRLGPYNVPSATFTKQYPVTVLISPPSGGSAGQTPTFIWAPVNGAAYYVFEVSKFPTFSPLYDSVVTINSQFTPTMKYESNTVYYWRVAIRDRDGRDGPYTDGMIIVDTPIVGLTAYNDSPTQVGDPTNFSAAVQAGTNVSYAWNFGDGDLGSGEDTSHTYDGVGNYVATVIATNLVSTAVATTTVIITDVPITGLVATNNSPTELGDATVLTATINTGTNVVYTWNFGDGIHGDGKVVTHTYTAVGNFTAQVTATNGYNSVTANTIVHILDIPIAGLQAENSSPTYLGDTTWFSATIVSGTNPTYSWAFGDGGHGSGAFPNHVYPSLGVYTAVVTATNTVGSLSTSTEVSILEEPITGLTAGNDSPTYLGDATHFTALVTGGTSVTYAWDFGDGTTGSGATPSHPYGDLGEFTAVVTATNSVSSQTATTLVTIVDMPISGLVATNDSPTELGSSTTLTATVAAGTHVSYTWDLGDGFYSDGGVVTHTYPVIGEYTALVTATNGTNTMTSSCLVVITDIPISGLVATNDSPTLLGETTTFTATITAGSGVTYAWDFGDGTSGEGQVTSHVYTSGGNFTATVTATNSLGDIIATTQVVISLPQPEYFFVFLPLSVK